MGLRRSIWLVILCLLALLAACDEVPAETPTSDIPQDGAVLSLPTRTVKPIVSFTPRFTATPIPSATLTPSDTPTVTLTSAPPSATHTPSPSITPTVGGVIYSVQNVNLREGPGEDYPIALTLPPGTEVGVLAAQTDIRGREWYKIMYTDENGQEFRLWVYSSLLTTNYKEVTAPPTAPPVTPAAQGSGTPATTRTPGLTPVPNRVNILAYCHQKNFTPPRPTTDNNVYIEWSWFVAQPDLMEQHLENAAYTVRLDGQRLENWSQYATEIKRESGVWIIYWYYPVGKLSAGEHKVTFELTWAEPITDGYNQFGPGTTRETDSGDCTFIVTEP